MTVPSSSPGHAPRSAAASPAAAPPGPEIEAAVERACAQIAPTWPLDRFIAVNPFWPRVGETLPAVSAELTALSGSRLLMPRAFYREKVAQGHLRPEHLRAALAESEAPITLAELQALLGHDEPKLPRRARVMDVVDSLRDLAHEMSWRDFVVHSTSQSCAAYFDEGQAQIGPDREGGLYASWRRRALGDRSPALLMGLRDYRECARRLPETPRELMSVALADLDIPPHELEKYLTGLLLDLNGWAAWCAYLRWTARLAGGDDDHLPELLAVRVAWEWLLLRAGGRGLASPWQRAMASWPAIDAAARTSQAHDWHFQRALEIAWQEDVCRRLPEGLRTAPAPEPPAVQAVFCIDVRSEVYRRALEFWSPRIQTVGFAGFFGLPIDYQPLAAEAARPQLPGLLAPRLRVTDSGAPAGLGAKRAATLEMEVTWKSFKTSPLSSFSFVESLGVFFAGKLLGDSFGRGPRASSHPERAGLSAAEHALRKPRLTSSEGGSPLTAEARVKLAEGILRAMTLTRDFARLVVLIGHGSETRNNPHAAGLDCGACCGQTGEVNARAAAALLNEPAIREGLAARGIAVPATTHFLAGLHNTTLDEVTLFDTDELPKTHQTDLADLRRALLAAGETARRERAPRLGLSLTDDAQIRAAVTDRARDWAQVRPEWGLTGNAAFLVAPREHTRHLDLAGRAFLHDYRHQDDKDFAILELILTAPMVVTHWINLQYYASTVDNLRYGSGNKVLHNVVGGHLGVFEGNGGDLRIGLPMQSLHDGARWVHPPLRLGVFVEAPREAIDSILRKHDKVRSLVDNEWLFLFQLDAAEERVWAHRRGAWVQASRTDD